jgi:hypothetical protein
MNFNFNFGKKKPDKKQIIIVSIILSTIMATLSQCTGVSENNFWDLFDEIQRKFFPQTILNDPILLDPVKLERRIKRDVDGAIDSVTPEYDRIIKEADKKYQPRHIESEIDPSVCYTNECQSLGGEMRICAIWSPDCVKKDDQQNDSISRS